MAPFMIMVICFAAFQATRDLGDLAALFAVGMLGVLMKRFGWPRPAFLIGFVLAGGMETYLYQAVQFDGWGFLTKPGVLIIGTLTLLRTMERFVPDTILVAWNCSTEAGRSLAHSLPLLQQARRVVVASVGHGEALQPSPEMVCEYLAAHGIGAEVVILAAGSRTTGEVLAETIADYGTDLVVMGTYDRKRLGEPAFGSVTHHMLAHSGVPLLLSR